jgi:ketosteroid isomerase-like protein
MSNSDEIAVKNVVQKYIDGTYQGDVQALRDCFHPNAVMNGYLGDQLLIGGPESFFENMEKAPSMAEGGAPYQGNIISVDVVGNVASVTLKETGFGGDMAFTDYFHLLKEAEQWKIISKTFTTE